MGFMTRLILFLIVIFIVAAFASNKIPGLKDKILNLVTSQSKENTIINGLKNKLDGLDIKNFNVNNINPGGKPNSGKAKDTIINYDVLFKRTEVLNSQSSGIVKSTIDRIIKFFSSSTSESTNK